MDLQLKGKRALVTGSSGGIGEGIAKFLAAEGAAVVVHGRNAQGAQRVASEIQSKSGRAEIALGDLAKDDQARTVSETAMKAFGGIDILVNNAGGYAMKSWMDSSPAKWAEMFNEDMISMVRMVQAVVPSMRTTRWGRIIQISSGVAQQPFPTGPDYAATKAAVNNASVSLAKELSGTGITVNTVSPGPIVTEGFKKLFEGIAAQQNWGSDWSTIEQNAVKHMMPNPSNRLGRIEDVASLVAFLASPLSGYINGANLRVDGGLVVTVN